MKTTKNTLPVARCSLSESWNAPLSRATRNEQRATTIALTAIATVLLMAGPAQADNECGIQSGTTPVVCNQALFSDGVTYEADGDLVIQFQGTTNEVAGNGIVLTGDGTESIHFDSQTTATELESRDTIGALLDVTTVDGDIHLMTEEMDADGQGPSGVTRAIRAQALGLGNINIDTLGDLDVASGANPANSVGIEAITANGDIVISTGGDVLGNAYGIRAEASGAGNIDISTTGISGNGLAQDIIGNIAAGTAGGDVSIELTGPLDMRTSEVMANAGGGDITIRLNGEASRLTLGDGVFLRPALTTITEGDAATLIDLGGANAAITSLDATIGSGGLVLNHGIDAACDGLACQNVLPHAYVQNITVNGPGSVAIRLLDHSDQLANQSDTGSVNTRRLNEHRLLRGVHDFSGIGGNVSISLEANTFWQFDVGANSLMSPGADIVQVTTGAGLFTSLVGDTGSFALGVGALQDAVSTLDFGAGMDEVLNAGAVYVGPITDSAGVNAGALIPIAGGGFEVNYDFIRSDLKEGYHAELRLENLETFSNTGTIWLGATFVSASRDFLNSTVGEGGFDGEFRDGVLTGTDRWMDDILALPNATFVGQAGSRIMVDANLNAVGQTECSADARGDNGVLANDCINLRGADAGASGQTQVEVFDVFSGARGAYNPDGNVVVDLAGADPANIDPSAFVLAPESSAYTSGIGNGAIDKGLFFYTLAFDPDQQQFRLYGLQAAGTQQMPILATAANSVWNTATGGWFDQRADERAQGIAPGLGGGVWFRAADDTANRDLITPITAGAETFTFDNGYEQRNTTMTLGLDFVDRVEGDSRWNLGVMAGYARGRVDFDDTPNNALLAGMHAGIYSSYTHGAFYLDAAFNQNWLDLDSDVPRMQLDPEGTLLSSEIKSHGLRFEGGWRFTVMERFGIEPLLGYAQVTSEVDDLVIPTGDTNTVGGIARFEDASSQRTTAGVRLSVADLFTGFAPTEISLTARSINETDNAANVSVANAGVLDAPAHDALDGRFTQLTGTVRMSNASKTVAGYLNLDSLTGDDYDSFGFSAGFRYQW